MVDIPDKKEFLIEVSSDLTLKILQPSDVADQYIAWMNDEEIVQFTEQNKIKHTKDTVTYFVQSMLSSEENYLFGIFYQNLHIGNIKLGPVNFLHQKGDISYIIGNKSFWGKGIATVIIGEIVNFAFQTLQLQKLYASVYENNIGSSKVLLKNGFIKEGHYIKDILFNGKRIDQFRYGLLKD